MNGVQLHRGKASKLVATQAQGTATACDRAANAFECGKEKMFRTFRRKEEEEQRKLHAPVISLNFHAETIRASAIKAISGRARRATILRTSTRSSAASSPKARLEDPVEPFQWRKYDASHARFHLTSGVMSGYSSSNTTVSSSLSTLTANPFKDQ
eukprot:1278103-Rhodomonas_salina.1